MTPDYEKMASLLASSNIYNSVSELHGVVCGQVCSGAKEVKSKLTQQLMSVEEAFSPVVEQLLIRLGKNATEQMSAGDFSFQLLLPEDEEDLNLRLHALGRWCEGFNVGFGGAFGRGDSSILEETREVLKDFAAIAEIEDSAEEPELEQNEEDYMEIVEYVRMAATTVFMQSTSVAETGSVQANNIH